MKTIKLIASSCLFLFAAAGFSAENSQTTGSNWTCSTNASRASSAAEKQADDNMSQQARSAKDAFNYAVQNCRDCTKITCKSGR